MTRVRGVAIVGATGVALAALIAGASIAALAATNSLKRPETVDSAVRQQGADIQADIQLLPGDRIRLNVFERVDLEEDQWAQRKRAGKPDQSFYPRQDLSGDFIVQADGSLPLPLLGNISVDNKTANAVMQDIGERFQKLTTHTARITYAILERQPISIVGPVKQPGVYKFAEGMTVLHAIALAGGYKATDDSWGKVEFAKQNAALSATRQRWQRYAAEAAVLRAERDHAPDNSALKDIDSIDRAAIEAARGHRARIRQANAQRRAVLASSLAAAEELSKTIEERVRVADQAVRDRRERVQALRKLVDKSTIGRPVFLQANVELSEAEERRIQAAAALGEARFRTSHARLELAKFDIDARVDLDNLTQQRSQEAADAEAAMRASEATVLALAPDAQQVSEKMGVEIIRRSKTGWNLLPGDSYTSLKPGDLVVIGRQQSTVSVDR